MWPCLAAACQPGRGDYIDMRRLRACPGSPGGENFQMVPQPPLPERAVNFHTLCSCAYMFPSESNVKGTPKSTPIYTHYRNPSATHSLAAGAVRRILAGDWRLERRTQLGYHCTHYGYRATLRDREPRAFWPDA